MEQNFEMFPLSVGHRLARLILIAALLLNMSSPLHAEPTDWLADQPGTFAVGLQVVHQYDYTRQYLGAVDRITGTPTTTERARPIQTLIWYPAQPSSPTMTFGSYFAFGGSEDRFDLSPQQAASVADAALRDLLTPAMDQAHLQQLETVRMLASQDAKPLVGKFPVIIYAPSFSSTAYENADLCEYLASHGYLVIASPDLGTHSRPMTKDVAGVESAAGDIAFLMGFARSLPQADIQHVAVIGFSWGGLANVAAAAKDARISALVALDGSVRYFPKLVKDMPYITPESIAVPMLYAASHPKSIEQLIREKHDLSGSFLETMRYSDLYFLTMNPMIHADFCSMFLRLSEPHSDSDYSLAEAAQGYRWMTRYVLGFLDAYLKNDSSAKTFLTNQPAANGVPPHLMESSFRAASGPAPTREWFAQQLRQHGFDQADTIYRETHARDPDFVLDELALGDWAGMLAHDHLDDAIELSKLLVKLYPNSADGYEALAGLYEQARQNALALQNYRRCLELNPRDDYARSRIQALGGNRQSGR